MTTSIKHCRRIMCAFVIGQVVQIVMFIVATAMGSIAPTLWASAAGLIIALAIFAGMGVVTKEIGESTKTTRSRGSKED